MGVKLGIVQMWTTENNKFEFHYLPIDVDGMAYWEGKPTWNIYSFDIYVIHTWPMNYADAMKHAPEGAEWILDYTQFDPNEDRRKDGRE